MPSVQVDMHISYTKCLHDLESLLCNIIISWDEQCKEFYYFQL